MFFKSIMLQYKNRTVISFCQTKKPAHICKPGLFVIFNIHNNVFHAAVYKAAQVVQRDGAYRLVVLKPIQKTAADAELVYQLIGRNVFLLQGAVKWLV